MQQQSNIPQWQVKFHGKLLLYDNAPLHGDAKALVEEAMGYNK